MNDKIEDMNNVPVLRFPEFSGAWVEKRLEDIFNEFKSGHTITSVNIFKKGLYPVFGGNGKRGYTNKYTHDGFYMLIGRQGALCGNINRVYGKVYISEHAIACAANNDSDTEWLAQRLDFFNLNRLSESSAQPGLSVNKLLRVKIIIPTQLEQKRIANFLMQVDKRIEKLEEKKAKLEEYKKGVIQKIFSQDIRFKDDDGKDYPAWEEKKLGDIGVFKSGTGFSEKEQGGQLGIPFYKVSDMNLYSNKILMNDANNNVSEEQIIKNKYKVIRKKSIIFAKVGAAIFLERKRIAVNFLIDNNMMAYIPNGNIMFYLYFFQSIRLSKFAQITALPSYNSSDISTIRVLVPFIIEQQMIANFLTLIDKQIEKITKQIEFSKNFKKGLLQKIFL